MNRVAEQNGQVDAGVLVQVLQSRITELENQNAVYQTKFIMLQNELTELQNKDNEEKDGNE